MLLLYLSNVFASNVSSISQETLNTERPGPLGVLRRNRTSQSRPGINFKIQIYQLSFCLILDVTGNTRFLPLHNHYF